LGREFETVDAVVIDTVGGGGGGGGAKPVDTNDDDDASCRREEFTPTLDCHCGEERVVSREGKV
jgi:hypothetical protein